MMVHEIVEIKKRLELLKEKYYENKGSHIDYYFDRIEADLERLEKYIQRRNETKINFNY
jgi:NAD-dependent DNA ligase